MPLDKIREGNVLGVGDYIYSPARVYFGTVEKDGNFNIYIGESPSDPTKERVWSSNHNAKPGEVVVGLVLQNSPFDLGTKSLQVFVRNPKGNKGETSLERLWYSGGSGNLKAPMMASLGDDGKLSLQQDGKEIWHNGYSDLLLEYGITSIAYDTRPEQVHRKPVGNPQTVEIRRVPNNTTINQTSEINASLSIKTTHSWSNKIGMTAGIKGTVKAGVPLVGEVSVEMSASVTEEFTFGKSTETNHTLTIPLKVTVPPGRVCRAYASVSQVEFELPYTTIGVYRFKSGKTVNRTIEGTFKGVNGYIGEAGFDDITDTNKPKNLFTVKSYDLQVSVDPVENAA